MGRQATGVDKIFSQFLVCDTSGRESIFGNVICRGESLSPNLLHVFRVCQEHNYRQEVAHRYVTDICKEAQQVEQKLAALVKLWPEVLRKLVEDSVVDMWDDDAYMKKCMDELERA